MKPKTYLLALATLAAFFSSGYAADKPKTFALVPKSISVPFYADVEKGCKEEAEKLGVKLVYTGPNTPDEAEQVQILRDVVARGVNGLAIAPMNADSVVGVIADARKKGIPVITFDSDSPKSERICYVGTDNYEAGKEAGKAFRHDSRFKLLDSNLDILPFKPLDNNQFIL